MLWGLARFELHLLAFSLVTGLETEMGWPSLQPPKRVSGFPCNPERFPIGPKLWKKTPSGLLSSMKIVLLFSRSYTKKVGRQPSFKPENEWLWFFPCPQPHPHFTLFWGTGKFYFFLGHCTMFGLCSGEGNDASSQRLWMHWRPVTLWRLLLGLCWWTVC